MPKVEDKLEAVIALAEELKRNGFSVEVVLCGDMPCLHAYKKPVDEDLNLEKLRGV